MHRAADPQHGAGWHSQPVVWLGIFIFALSIAGCLWLIVTGLRYDDQPLDTSRRIFGVPTGQSVQPVPPAPPASAPMRSDPRSGPGSETLSRAPA